MPGEEPMPEVTALADVAAAGDLAGRAVLGDEIDYRILVGPKQDDNLNSKPEDAAARFEAGRTRMASDTNAETEETIDLWTKLSPERRLFAKEAISAMSEKYDRPIEDFGLIEVVEKDASNEEVKKIKAVLTAENGIDLGDPQKEYDPARNWYNTTTQDKEAKRKFQIEVDGKVIDVRKAQNIETLKAIARVNPEIYDEWEWLVNGQAEEGCAGAVIINNGAARLSWKHCDMGNSDLLPPDSHLRTSNYDGNRGVVFRPIVTIN